MKRLDFFIGRGLREWLNDFRRRKVYNVRNFSKIREFYEKIRF
jgi:hypothetical protein